MAKYMAINLATDSQFCWTHNFCGNYDMDFIRSSLTRFTNSDETLKSILVGK